MSQFDDFHLGEYLSHASGGIRTLFRFSESEIGERKARVVNILDQKSGLSLEETPDGPALDFAQVRASNIVRVLRLLEENSVLLDALHYLSGNVAQDWKCIGDITTTLLVLKKEMMLSHAERVNIYNFVDVNIGEIIGDFFTDIASGNYTPTETEKTQLTDLHRERENWLNFFNHPKESILLG